MLKVMPSDEPTELTDEAMTPQHQQHVVFLVHGLGGTPDDLFPLERKIKHHDGQRSVLSHVCVANTPKTMTRDGVGEGGLRIAQEIRTIVSQNPDLKYISLIGNSLGGIYCRYAAMELFNPEIGTIAGLRPISFITIASPHLGVRNYCVAPRMLQKLLYGFSGRTIKELFLADREDGQHPLLMRMATEDNFTLPLSAFSRVRAYGSRAGDLVVPFGTALFGVGSRSDSTLLKGLSLHTHQAPTELETRILVEDEDFEEGVMMQGLNTAAEWSKIVVEWHNSFRSIPYTAHNRVVAINRNFLEAALNRVGRPVLDHISMFVIQE